MYRRRFEREQVINASAQPQFSARLCQPTIVRLSRSITEVFFLARQVYDVYFCCTCQRTEHLRPYSHFCPSARMYACVHIASRPEPSVHARFVRKNCVVAKSPNIRF